MSKITQNFGSNSSNLKELHKLAQDISNYPRWFESLSSEEKAQEEIRR